MPGVSLVDVLRAAGLTAIGRLASASAAPTQRDVDAVVARLVVVLDVDGVGLEVGAVVGLAAVVARRAVPVLRLGVAHEWITRLSWMQSAARSSSSSWMS